MWFKVFSALKFLVKYAPAVVEVVKKARERHPEEHVEEAPKVEVK